MHLGGKKEEKTSPRARACQYGVRALGLAESACLACGGIATSKTLKRGTCSTEAGVSSSPYIVNKGCARPYREQWMLNSMIICVAAYKAGMGHGSRARDAACEDE